MIFKFSGNSNGKCGNDFQTVQIFCFMTAIISNENRFYKEAISLEHWIEVQIRLKNDYCKLNGNFSIKE